MFRGYLLRNLRLWRGRRWALAGSTLLFGAVHGVDPGIGILALINTVLIGLLLAGLRIRFSLWSAISFHAAWNWLLALSAVPVSGMAFEGTLLVTLSGPALLTGGLYGLEGSLIATVLVSDAAVIPLRRRPTAAVAHHTGTAAGRGSGSPPAATI